MGQLSIYTSAFHLRLSKPHQRSNHTMVLSLPGERLPEQDYVDQKFSNALCLLVARLFNAAAYFGDFARRHTINASSE